MPYLQKDSSGQIIKITLIPTENSIAVKHDNPELKAFLEKYGQEPTVIDKAMDYLQATDKEMGRASEDIVMMLLNKNVLSIDDLPLPLQTRLEQRAKRRILVQDIYLKANEAAEKERGH